MLVNKQIRGLAKPYSDRAMISLSDRCALGPESTPMWSNLTVIFFGEPKPKSVPNNFEPSALQPNNTETIQGWCENPGVQVWPVEIGPLYSDGHDRNGSSLILLRFVDETGHSHWFDAKYVSAVLKRHKDPDWYYSEGRLMAKDSTQVTVATDDGVKVTLPKGDPIAILKEWAWGPNPAAAIDNYREWDPDWRLCNECTASWQTLRWAQRLDRALPKGKRGSRFTTLNGGSPARRVKLGRHKYIELASKNSGDSIRISLYNGEVTNLTQEVINE